MNDKNYKIGKIGENKFLFSYNTNVCNIVRENGEITIILGKKWDFSITTRKHIYKFLHDELGLCVDGQILNNSIENGFLIGNHEINLYYDYEME